jgi:penicillin amidase
MMRRKVIIYCALATAILLAGLIIAAAVFALDRYTAMRASLPQIEGDIRVSGIESPVDILRDSYGVPHIFAAGDNDALFGLGFAHAQDRLWQMELARLSGQGRLAEVLGARALPSDRLMRTLNLNGAAQKSYERLAPETRAAYAAYAQGVNAFIRSHEGALAPEFALLLHEPEPWQPSDGVLILKLMAFRLSTNMFEELTRAGLLTRLDAEKVDQFFASHDDEGPITLAGIAEPLDFAGIDFPGILRMLPENLLPPPSQRDASNNWVVSGQHSWSQRPLLANDPHLGMSAPSAWYLAHLAVAGGPAGNVIGGTLPGVPAIILGRNDYIAWGFTNTGADTQDLFLEEILADDPTRYRTPEGSAAFNTRDEHIKVRWGLDITLKVRETRHGPVLPIADDDIAALPLDDGTHVLALAWTALLSDDRTADASLGAMRARDWRGFLSAMRNFHTPMQNVVYADTEGNIGFIAPARVPVRGPKALSRGLLPEKGWEAGTDWQGFIAFDELPRGFNPSGGIFLSANNKIVPDSYPHFLAANWEVPYRAQRIADLLSHSTAHHYESFRAMQNDILSLGAVELKTAMLARIERRKEHAILLETLAKWDGTMRGSALEPLLFTAWVRSFARRLYADELGPYFSSQWTHNPPLLLGALRAGDARMAWCDDVTTADGENCPRLLAEALSEAVDELRDQYGTIWQIIPWQKAHSVVNRHLPFTLFPILRDHFDIVRPSEGGAFTLNRGQMRFSDKMPYANVHAAGYRAIYDLSGRQSQGFIQSTGQSGNVFSVHYDDLAELWANGRHIPMTTARKEIEEKGDTKLLRLQPAAPDDRAHARQ